MKNIKTVRNISLALTIAVGGSFVIPSLVSAKSIDKPSTNISTTTTSNTKQSSISQALINKATPYIKTTKNSFYLSKEGYSKLNKDELKTVLDCIKDNNQNLKEVINSNDITKNGNTFIQSLTTDNMSANKSNGKLKMSVASVSSSSSYMSVRYTWWGAQIYFSHRAINDFKDYMYLGGTVGGFLAKAGKSVASGYLSSIALVGGALVWSMTKVDEGRGVYLNCVLYVPATFTPA